MLEPTLPQQLIKMHSCCCECCWLCRVVIRHQHPTTCIALPNQWHVYTWLPPKNDSWLPLACLLRLDWGLGYIQCLLCLKNYHLFRQEMTVWTVQQQWQAKRRDRAGTWDHWCLTITLLLKANWIKQSMHILIIDSEILLSASIDCCVLYM